MSGTFRDGIEAAAAICDQFAGSYIGGVTLDMHTLERTDAEKRAQAAANEIMRVSFIEAATKIRALTPPPASGDREGLTDAILSATDKDGDQLFFAGHFNTRGAAAELLADAILSWMRAAGFKRGDGNG